MPNNILDFASKRIGKGEPTCIVFEAGATHDGLETAKKLVDIAAHTGADAIKFQMLDAKRLVPSAETMFSYDILCDKVTGKTEIITESLQAILLRRELSESEWTNLIAYCKQKKVLFFSTATTVEELKFLYNAGCDCVKIASGDINYHWFLRQAAHYPWIVQIDTGNATLGEVEQAVDVLEDAGCSRILINHCPSGYPAHLDGINLRILTTLQQMFPYPVAFSDHTSGVTMDIAAVSLGAHMIEKTITLDKCIRSPEHIMSLEPHEAKDFVQTIRELEIALGNTRRIMTHAELSRPPVARRSVVAAQDIPLGAVITQEMIDYVRPGDGLPAHLDWLVLNKVTVRSLQKGEKLQIDDCILR